MDFPNLKELKKLAKACRSAGISGFKYFKDGSYEFQLDPSYSENPKRKSAKSKENFSEQNSPSLDVETDSLTDEQLMFWSSGQGDGANSAQ